MDTNKSIDAEQSELDVLVDKVNSKFRSSNIDIQEAYEVATKSINRLSNDAVNKALEDQFISYPERGNCRLITYLGLELLLSKIIDSPKLSTSTKLEVLNEISNSC